MMTKPTVLVICTGNSMRSQLAEGLLRADLGDYIEIFSAGTHPSSVHPLTIQALQAVGIDTTPLRSKSIYEFVDRDIDLAITLCDHAKTNCPVFPRAKKTIHKGYPDPVFINSGSDPAVVFAKLRDQMRKELRKLVVKELKLKMN
jgi:arsenate reductase (thioredoxin)